MLHHTHTNKPNYYGAGSVPVGSPAAEEESAPRRCALSPSKLITEPFTGITTTHDVILYAARTHGTRNALGEREVVAVHEEVKEMKDGTKKTWKYFELSPYKFLSFVEVKERVLGLAKGLLELGVGEGDVWNVYSQTSLSWQLMSHACAAISMTIATAYDTLGPAGLAHSLNEPNCIGLFTNAELLPTLYTVLKDTPSVKFIIYDGTPPSHLVDDLRAVREEIKAMSINELLELGKKSTISEETLASKRPKPDNLACIMYTSGSTGPPKGVCITHSNLIASIGGVQLLLGHHLTTNDSYLAYLPLAHVLEYIVELIVFFVGMETGFGRVKTLTDASVRNCQGDIREFRPTIMVGVPAVWEQIRKGILHKVNTSGTLRKSLFNGAMNAKKNAVPVIGDLMDKLILKGVREATGGRMRIALSGGAALSRETQEFLNVALLCLVQGYGMTESCGMCAILPPELLNTGSYGSVGLPVPSTEIKLLSVSELGYDATKTEKPQGEVCIRGPSVTKGYFKRPDLNGDRTVFTEDGWLRTGDIGQFNADGTLSLIDRVKNLVKLSGGEYVALERLESVYRGCEFVGNICVHASSAMKQPVAIIIPHEGHLRHALEVQGLAGVDPKGDLEVLCANEEIRALVLKGCNGVGKKNGFKSLELLQAVVLTAHEWTPESGLVTAAQKIQRQKIQKAFEKELGEILKKQNAD